jgi:hypothetical protein
VTCTSTSVAQAPITGPKPDCKTGMQPGTELVEDKCYWQGTTGPHPSFLCTYRGTVSGLGAAVTIEYECPNNESTWQGKARSKSTFGTYRGSPYIMRVRKHDPRDGPNPSAGQDGGDDSVKLFYRINPNVIATIYQYRSAEEGRALGYLDTARAIARANAPARASIGCDVYPDGVKPPVSSSEPDSGATDAGAGECTVEPKRTSESLPGVPVLSGGVEIEVKQFPEMPCFGDSLTIGFSGEKHDANRDGCASRYAVAGTVQNCVEAFCVKDCWTFSAGGGRDLTYEKQCKHPPQWECNPDRYCDKKSSTFGIERSSKLVPRIYVGFMKASAECGLELGAAVNVSGSFNTFRGPTCACSGGGWAGTARVGSTVSGGGNCEVRLFGGKREFPIPSVEGCFNFGLLADSAGCVPKEQRGGESGVKAIGGAALKLKLPDFKWKWFKINATTVVVDVPKGKGSGCSGATDM